MPALSRFIITAVVLLSIAPSVQARRRAVSPGAPVLTPCVVTGLPGIFLSENRGQSFSRNAGDHGLGGNFDIAVLLDDPKRLVTVVRRVVYDSTDGGCRWTERFTIDEEIKHPVHVVPGTGGRAFIWAEEFVYRYDEGAVIKLSMPEAPGALGVDSGNRERVRLLGIASGKSWESLDGGLTWNAAPGSAGGRISAAAFDVSDVNHIVAAVFSSSLVLSRDGGRSWSNAFTPSRTVCRLAFAPGSPNVVWMTTTTLAGSPSVFRSTDGGRRFEAIGTIASIENGVCLPFLASPHDSNIALIPHGALRVYDAATRNITMSDCCNGFIERAAYSPADPDVLVIYARPR